LEDRQFDLRGALGVVRRQWRLILATIIAIMGLAGVAILALKPVYTATALVLVDTSRKDLLNPESGMTVGGSESVRVESEVELARSETVLLRVVKNLGLLNEPDFASKTDLLAQGLALVGWRNTTPVSAEARMQAALADLRERISVQRRGLTYLIAVQAASQRPQQAAELANAIAEAYIAEQLESKIDGILLARNIVETRIADAGSDVSSSEGALDRFIDENIGAISEQTGRVDLERLAAEIADVRAERQRILAQLEQADEIYGRRDWAELTSTLQSDALAALEADRSQLIVADVASIDLKAELAAIDARLEQTAVAEITTLRERVVDQQSRVATMREQLRRDVLTSDLSSTTLRQIYELQQSAEIARTQYQVLLTRGKDLQQQAGLQIADSRIASVALPPPNPSFPNVRLLFAGAGGVAVAFALVLAFVYENLIGGVVNADQLRAVVRASTALVVPRQRGPKGSRSVADVVTQKPLSAFSESFRRIRVSLDQWFRQRADAPDASKGKVVLVTSTAPDEGKTTISLALARTYALAGQTTLLIDCDLRKPSLHEHLGLRPEAGLIDYLSGVDGKTNLSDLIEVDATSGAQVLLGGGRSQSSTDRYLTGSMFGRVVEAAVNTFDVVIVDTPPVGPVVDAVHLAQFADAVVLVVKWARTTQPDVRAAASTLKAAMSANASFVAVLNQSPARGAAYSAAYSNYYGEA
jgi:polysaccharide biosynthesis transport protein